MAAGHFYLDLLPVDQLYIGLGPVRVDIYRLENL